MRLALTAFLILAVAAFASDPRVAVITGDARLMDDDYLEIWAYPGTMVNYEFATVTNVGTTGNWGVGWAGLVMNNGGITWGVTHNHDGKLLEALYHGGNFGIIVGLDYDKYEYTVPDQPTITRDTEMAIDIAFGTEFDLFGDYSDFSIGVGYGSADSMEVYTASDIDFGASIRGHGDGFFNLFPIISAGYNSHKDEFTPPDTTYDFSTNTITFDFGAGKNFMFAPKTHIVTGIFAGIESVSYSQSVGDAPDNGMFIYIPQFKFGLEQYIGKWLVARVGGTCVTEIATYTRVATGNEISSIETDVITSFGIGLYWDNFMLDAVISDDFVHAGPYMIGGEDNGFLGNIAAVYNF